MSTTEPPASPRPSPLGRYDIAIGAGAQRFDVWLLGVPIDLYLATLQQHDEVVREFAVMGLGHGDEDTALPQDLRDLIHELGLHYSRSATRTDIEVEAAAQAGLTTVDLHYEVPATVVEGADRLESLMARADAFCEQGRMLAMPRSAAMQSLAAWWLGELRRQVAGAPPTAYSSGA